MPQNSKPNILFIFTDQHRLSAVGCYGETPCQTPSIDRLAETGLRFETAYTVCPVCSPARSTLMTGVYPHTNGVCSNVHDLGASVHELTDRPDLLSRRMQSLGYRCGYSGKWHLGTDRETAFGSYNQRTLPKDVGFSGQNFPGHGGGGFRYPEYQQYLAEHGWEHEVKRARDPEVDLFYRSIGILQGPIESTVPYFLAENSINLMEEAREAEQPFFVWHNFWGPHGPYFATQDFYDRYADVEIPEWPNYRWPSRALNGPHQVKIHPYAEEASWEDWAEGLRYYYAFTSLIDSQIGRMIAYLDRTGLRENTIIIFTADHGETLGSHGGLTDKCWHHFEEIQRVPFVVWMPEKYYGEGLTPGDVLQEWVSLADVYPTILELAGAERESAERHGRSIVPLLKSQPVVWRDSIFVEFGGVNSLATSMVSVRKGGFKYGWNCSNRDELYDLDADRYETVNLIDDPRYADTVIKMRKLIEEWMIETQYPAIFMYQQSRIGTYPWGRPR
jgi:arylsulfatase A-like enzyme